MGTFLALVVAVIALVMAKKARNEVRELREWIAWDQKRREAAAPAPRPQPAPEKPAPAPEPVIPIWQPPAQPVGAPFEATDAGGLKPAVAPLATPAFQSAAEAAAAPQEPPPPPPPKQTSPPPAAPAPSPIWERIDWESLVGVKLFSWVAGIAMVIAAIYFLRYSVEHGWISPPVRAAIGLITGSALLVICELRIARGYVFTANAMHGAGIAILYSTLFAVHALWHLLPPAVVFFGMLVVTAVAVLLSIRRDSLFIALLGMMGGFATPALLSTGENRPIALFSYLLLLNAGLAWVAYKKRWPALTLGSVAFSVIYQWTWIATFLDAAQFPLAVGIFLVFACAASAALWMRRDDSPQKLFDRAGEIGVALPLLFALFGAAVPAYGERYNILFAFLLLMAGGLAAIALIRKLEWLHALGGIATILTFAIWLTVSYTPDAWPAILAWTSAFVLLYLAVGMRRRTGVTLTAPALLFVLPGLLQLEPRAASPLILFGTLFVLLALNAAFALRSTQGLVYFVAAFFALLTEAIWSAKHLTEERLYAGMAAYAVFGLTFLAVPALARRFDRLLRPASGVVITPTLSIAMLLFVALSRTLAFPPWPFLSVLFLLNLAIGMTALYLRRGSLAIGAAVMSQIVLLAWSVGAQSAPWPNVALAATMTVAGLAGVWYAVARRIEAEPPGFAAAATAALILGHIVAITQGMSSTTPLFGTLLATHVLLAIGTLVLAAATGVHVLAVFSVPLTAIATIVARTESPGRAFTFAAVLYALYILYPLIVGNRVKRALEPYLAAVLASIPFFFFARQAMTDAGLGYVIGVLPVAQALLMLVLVVRLLRLEPTGERNLTRLAIVAGTALAFVTAAVPLQLEKEWITIAWALEGAALVWLFRRIPHHGLLAWAAGLLAAVFVRLTVNPAILAYHTPSDRAVLNWYFYTYLVCAIAFFLAAHLAPREHAKAAGFCRAAGSLLLFFLLNIEIADYFSTGPTLTFNFLSSSLAQDLTYTIGWALFAIAMLVAGIALHARTARVAAIALLVVTIFKCFLHDLGRLGGLYRIGSFLGLALALVLVSVLLQKFVLSRRAPAATPEVSS